MKEMWDKRYSSEEYVYGKSPNEFFKNSIDKIDKRGKLLLVAEGEGRNAVYAAKLGFSVYAFDISSEGRKKAIKLAEEENVEIDYQIGEIIDLNFEEESFDVVALIFAHLPPNLRSKYHHLVTRLLKPGGLIILEGFSRDNLKLREENPSIGGPTKIESLFSIEEIKNDFQSINKIMLDEVETVLNEGHLHKGLCKVVRFIGQKSIKGGGET